MGTDTDYARFEDVDVKQQPYSLRTAAFLAVVFATVAVSGCLVAVPLVFHRVQVLQAAVQADVVYCKMHTRDLWKRMTVVSGESGAPGPSKPDNLDVLLRSARQVDDQCCTCQQGPPGPAGNPGRNGNDGSPGNDGGDGNPGIDAGAKDTIDRVQLTLCPCQALRGPPGPKGRPGGSGDAGRDGGPGNDGRPGGPGPRGEGGNPGAPGNPGNKGPPGPDGNLTDGPTPPNGPPGPRGAPGRPGSGGRPGAPGSGGDNGAPGAKGRPGTPGDRGGDGNPGQDGQRGQPGPRGTCDFCPPPRLASGY